MAFAADLSGALHFLKQRVTDTAFSIFCGLRGDNYLNKFELSVFIG
jgi:hypothetical protein